MPQFYYRIEKNIDGAYGDICHSVVWVSTHTTIVDDDEAPHLTDAIESNLKKVGIADPDNLMEGCWGIDTEQQATLLEQELKNAGWGTGMWPSG